MKKLSLLIAAFSIPATVHAQTNVPEFQIAKFKIPEASFTISLHDNKTIYCDHTEGREARLSIGGLSSGKIISRGCWTILKNGDYSILLDERFPISGEMIVDRDLVKEVR